MTDINDLDRHIGRYVDFRNGDEGAAGFLVDVADGVIYEPKLIRVVTFDWGQSWPVTEGTVMTFPEPPEGEEVPQFSNPVRVMHLAMHNGADCPNLENCAYEKQSARAVQAFRSWRMKQADAFWEHRYVKEVRSYAKSGDGHEVSDIIRDAVHEGAPPHMVERMERIAREYLGDPAPVKDWDPWGGSEPGGSGS